MNRAVSNLVHAARHPVETYRNDKFSANYILFGAILELANVENFLSGNESVVVFAPTSIAFLGSVAFGATMLALSNNAPEDIAAEQ